MKKWIIGFLILALGFFICVYTIVPNIVSSQNSISIQTNAQAFSRTILDDKSWGKWWPGEVKIDSKNGLLHLSFNGYTYTIVEKKFNSIVLSMEDKNNSARTLLNFIPVTQDSVHLIWLAQSTTSTKPLKRLQLYFKSKDLNNDMDTILVKMQSFFSKPQNIYGTQIQSTLVSDSLLVSTFASSKDYPSTEFIYGLIGQLKNYIADQSAKETGNPMLHITTADSINYLTRVAIPVERRLKPSGNISYKWMMGGGQILVTEVKGGPAAIHKAFQQMENYVRDHNRTAPAIPFQSLITDRMKEKDTSKWITKIYYPVM